jgi:uncharacterized protein (TIGR03067 family)
MCYAVVLGLLVISSGFSTAADSDTIQKGMNEVNGTWQAVAQFRDGQPVPEDEYDGAQLIVEDGKFTVRRGDEVLHAGTFQLLDVESGVGRAEVEYLQGPRAGQRFKQTSKLQAKTMTLCFAPIDGDWPKDFASTSADRRFLAVYKRVRR